MKVDTVYDIWGCTLLAGVALLAASAIYKNLTRKEEPVKPESVTERIFREYDLDGDRTLNREELSNLLEDYQPRGEQ